MSTDKIDNSHLCAECTGAGNSGEEACKVCRGTGYVPFDQMTMDQKKLVIQDNLNVINDLWNDLKAEVSNGEISMILVPNKLYGISTSVKNVADFIVTEILKIKEVKIEEKSFVVWIHPESDSCGVWTREQFKNHFGSRGDDGCLQEFSDHDTFEEAVEEVKKLAISRGLSWNIG